ncbi:MAG: glycosyltransferase [Pyrinomonadaceae bacterium]
MIFPLNDIRDIPRVALFADTFHEINGAALTCRQLEHYARSAAYPFLSIHAGQQTSSFCEGTVLTQEFKRFPLSFKLDDELRYDPLFWRHLRQATRITRDFKADLVHITGLNDVGQIGASVAYRLGIPLIASWHTNIHEFAARRLDKFLFPFPANVRRAMTSFAAREILRGTIRFYKLAHTLLAPNKELVQMLATSTSRPVFMMRRGIDTDLFSPAQRTVVNDGVIRLGFVGRIRPEKNVRLLAEVEKALVGDGITNFRFTIVGEGSERTWLEQNMRFADFAGVLTGEALARAYANMDLFLFPSRTDTFGNVILEAMASGVPAVVTSDGGPKYIVQNGVTGMITDDDQAFISAVKRLISDQERLRQMKIRSRKYAQEVTWAKIFDEIYQVYSFTLLNKS